MPLPRIAVLGSLNIDIVSYVPHHPSPGETLTSTFSTTSPGGKGANQAVACAKLSRPSTSTSNHKDTTTTSAPAPTTADIYMLGAVGDDAHGSTLLSSLAAHGVDTKGVSVRPNAKTGMAVIIVDQPTGQNRIVLSPEANHSFADDEFASLPMSWDPDLLVMQLEIPRATVLSALRGARDRRLRVLLNPAPAQHLPDEAYQGLDHLVVNESEAAILSAEPEAVLDSVQGVDAVASLFLDRGVGHVVVTLGSRGAYYATRAGQRALVPAVDTTVVDTTAAGDTFVGSYALALVQTPAQATFDIDAAVKAAVRASSITVSRKGAQVSIPWMDQL